MSAEYRAPLTRPLKINVEYARSLHPIRLQRQITKSYTRLSSCGRSISGKTNLHRLLAPCDTEAISRMLRRNRQQLIIVSQRHYRQTPGSWIGMPAWTAPTILRPSAADLALSRACLHVANPALECPLRLVPWLADEKIMLGAVGVFWAAARLSRSRPLRREADAMLCSVLI